MSRKLLSVALFLVTFCGFSAVAQSPFDTLHVSVSGNDQDAGTPAAPLRTIKKAVSAMAPGDLVLVHAGVYREVVTIYSSGLPERRSRLKAAADGEVVIQPDLPRLSCSATSPTGNRAIEILEGADNWAIRGLTVVGGILVSGGGNPRALARGVFMDRTLPGRGAYDPEAAKTTLPNLGIDPADNIRIFGNKVTGRGIYVRQSRYGQIVGNEVSHTECGSGGAVIVTAFSDFWRVRNNYVHHTAATPSHFMNEGIRVANASMYNLVENNLVEDLEGLGRGINADVNGSWNSFRNNTVRRASEGYSEQHGGWGNQWINNLAESNRSTGFGVDMKDTTLPLPTDGSPAYMVLKCNAFVNNEKGMALGALQASTFEGNAANVIFVGRSLRDYWKSVNNTWNGSAEPPADDQASTAGSDCAPGLSNPSALRSALGTLD